MKSSSVVNHSPDLRVLGSFFRSDTVADQAAREEIACHCYGVTESAVKKVVCENALTTVSEITAHTQAGGACRACTCRLKGILADLPSKGEMQFNILAVSSRKPTSAFEQGPLV